MEVIIILILAAMLWAGMRRQGPPAPRTAPDVAIEGARVGCGFPLAIMIVLAVMLLASMGGAMLSGGCDPNAGSGQPGECLEVGQTRMEDALGWKHYNGLEDWWADPINPFK